MNYNEALQIMLDSDHRERQTALNYILSHPACLARIDQLARAIITTAEDELTCAESRTQLADYYIRQQTYNDAEQQFPLLHIHLRHCPYCQLEYGALGKTMSAFADGTLPAVAPSPPFALDFLDQPLPRQQQLPVIWRVYSTIRKLLQPIQVVITQSSATIEAFTLQLTPELIPQSMRGKDDIQYSILSLPDETGAIRFHFDIKPTPKGAAVITLSIFDIATAQPIPDVRVALDKADGTPVTSSLTDSEGKLVLPQLIADHYVIQARANEQTWEIPITIIRH